MLCRHAFATTYTLSLQLVSGARACIGSSTVTSCVRGLFSTSQTVYRMVAAAFHKTIALPSAIACAALSATAAPMCLLTTSAGNVCRMIQSYLWAGAAAGHKNAVVPEAGPAHPEHLHAMTVAPATSTHGHQGYGSEEGHAPQVTPAAQLAATSRQLAAMSHAPLLTDTTHTSSSLQQPASPSPQPEVSAAVLAALDSPSGEHAT